VIVKYALGLEESENLAKTSNPYNHVQCYTSMLLMFNKNKRISSLITAIIIIIPLSFFPLNDDHTSGLLLFSTEPVFAQLSGQTIPYRE
jgi:hypothetical protein